MNQSSYYISLHNCTGLSFFYSIYDDGNVFKYIKQKEEEFHKDQLHFSLYCGFCVLEAVHQHKKQVCWLEINYMNPKLAFYTEYPSLPSIKPFMTINKFTVSEIQNYEDSIHTQYDVALISFACEQDSYVVYFQNNKEVSLWFDYLQSINASIFKTIYQPKQIYDQYHFQSSQLLFELDHPFVKELNQDPESIPMFVYPSMILQYYNLDHQRINQRFIQLSLPLGASYILDADLDREIYTDMEVSEEETHRYPIIMKPVYQQHGKEITINSTLFIKNYTHLSLNYCFSDMNGEHTSDTQILSRNMEVSVPVLYLYDSIFYINSFRI